MTRIGDLTEAIFVDMLLLVAAIPLYAWTQYRAGLPPRPAPRRARRRRRA